MSRLEFRRPLGLVLSGGGSLGAWQAGCLTALGRHGLRFDRILGFSSGALNGSLSFLGRWDELTERWRRLGEFEVFRFSPRLNPLSLFSEQPLRDRLSFAANDGELRPKVLSSFTVVSLCLDDAMPVYACFDPPGQGRWDPPFVSWIAASCAVPYVFPPVLIGRRRFIDGGVPGREWMRFDPLSGCRDVLVLEMVRADEIGRRPWGPVSRLDQKSREIVRRQISCGIESLVRQTEPPRVYRLAPSQRLDFCQLAFRPAECIRALELGRSDALRFLEDPNPQALPPAS